MEATKIDFVLKVLHLTRRNVQSLLYQLPVKHDPSEYESLACWLNQVDEAIIAASDKTAVNCHDDLLTALETYQTVLAELQQTNFSSTAIAAWTRLGHADTRAQHAIQKAKGA